jgi:hypothetical protein
MVMAFFPYGVARDRASRGLLTDSDTIHHKVSRLNRLVKTQICAMAKIHLVQDAY